MRDVSFTVEQGEALGIPSMKLRAGLNGVILGMKRSEIDHKFDEIVVFSGVEQFIDTPVKRYSTGR